MLDAVGVSGATGMYDRDTPFSSKKESFVIKRIFLINFTVLDLISTIDFP